jgi:type IV secretory pathway VirB10-like protein
MIRWLIGGIVVLLLAVLFVLWIRPSRSARPINDPPRVTDVKPSVPVEKSSVPVEKQSAPVIPQPPIPSAAPAQPAVNPNQPSDSRREQETKWLEHLRPKLAGPLDVLKRVYRTESRDATSQDTERLIREQFGPEYLPSDALQNVTCHKSVCKIEMFWTEQRPTVVMALTMKIGPLMTGHMAFEPASEPDSKGRVLVEMYIVRAGYDIENMK